MIVYRIHLIRPDNLKDVKVFKTCLQHIFSLVKLKSDKDKLYQYMQEHQRELQSMDYIETMAAFVLLGETKRAEQILYRAEEGENVDMCKAIDDLIKDGEKRGEQKLAALMNIFIKNDWQHLIPRIIQDISYREEMYQKYQI